MTTESISDAENRTVTVDPAGVSPPAPSQTSALRHSTIIRKENGDVMGVPVVLSEADLVALGIDVDSTEQVCPRVENGMLHIDPVS